ncbi:hypothetical protein K2P97_04630 [bacterium]|nr:hypothetical protein [bacterium]
MKLISALILLLASVFWLFRAKKNIIPKQTAKSIITEKVLKSPHIEIPETHDLKIFRGDLAELNHHIKKYEHLNYETFNQGDLKLYNQLVFEKAMILKRQIFSKAAKKGYYL